MLSENDWTVNGFPRLKDQGCQLISAAPNACDTCPLAEKEPENPPSPFLQHLVYLADLQEVGAQFAFSDLTLTEWEGLKILKRKRDEKQIRDLKQK